MPPIIFDLAVILITAGVITVIFKRLNQPLVLGYIVAGFFIGPYFPWFPAVTDETNVKVWSDIGIVFLMFALGLEFSIKKLKRVGATGAITAMTELLVMFLTGNLVGHLLGWRGMDCVFLGCMLSISSTTIIIKSFDDLKMKGERFTSTVTAVLVVEDLIAVLLLVMLSTLSVSRSFDGVQLVLSLGKLVFSLIVWFAFGIFLIPTFLRWMRRYMTEETLCIVAVGLCFGMVVMAWYAGFSTALGAFVMGAILSETIEAEVIHRVVQPIKNLFGAVFFVGVGMLVDPKILVGYWMPILVIAGTVVVVKSLSATLGVVLSGKEAKTAVESGFCFCQIGEFSFIIAGLGLSFGVINADLYPIVVSVSVITTFVTPYMIKAADPVYEAVYPKLPVRLRDVLERYSRNSKRGGREVSIRRFLKKQFSAILFFGAILMALTLLSEKLLKPFLNATFVTEDGGVSMWGNWIGLVATLTLMAPFLWAMAMKGVSRQRIAKLLRVYGHSHAVVLPVLLLRHVVALCFIGYVISVYLRLAAGLLMVLVLVVMAALFMTRRATGFYRRIEGRFVSNFNERQAQQSFRMPDELAENFYMERMTVTPYSGLVGKRLSEAGIRKEYGVNVVSIERGGKVYDLPSKETIFMPMDRVTVIGGEEQLAVLRLMVEAESERLIEDHSDNELNIYRLEVRVDSPLIGVSIEGSKFQSHYHSMIIAIERGERYLLNPERGVVFEMGDVVWFVSPEDIALHDIEKISHEL